MNILTLIPIFSDWTLLFLRLVIAAIFLAHGLPKIKNLKQNAQNFAGMGFKPGVFWGTIVAFVEVFGGLAVLLGVYVQFAGILLAINMLVATLWKKKQGMKLVNGYELDLMLLTASLVLATIGPGVYGFQNYLPF